jgi:hypothetical protein
VRVTVNWLRRRLGRRLTVTVSAVVRSLVLARGNAKSTHYLLKSTGLCLAAPNFSVD